ncbi:uncharacterized protein LOC132393204 isoform X3 [Hypanus sabinus]|uniref:uncharacterized protein LOC132393204 isoform X3 n=1 Tax=Hypanus sabinus TaxID=79690 RepID=UPI0028C389E0|nr:uncharacterized protein LOC132393204 isoform X3 [Hypanus sabinus]
MAAAQKSASQQILEDSSAFTNITSTKSALLPRTGNDNQGMSLKCQNRKLQSCNRAESCYSDDEPGTPNISKKQAFPQIGSRQRSRCCTEIVEKSSKKMETVENMFLLHFLHSFQEKSSFADSLQGVKSHSLSMPNIHKQSDVECTDKQIDVDIVESVIGDELEGKSSCGHAVESMTIEKEQDSNAISGQISCLDHITGEPPSEHSDTHRHKEGCQLQAIASTENVKQSMTTKLQNRESSCSSIRCSSTSSFSAHSLMEGRDIELEQASHCVDPRHSETWEHSLKLDMTSLPDNTGETRDEFYTTMVAPALRQHIEHLKCHLNDLQDANDSTINELTKADEEISQLRHEIAELKAKHAGELQLVKQESDYFKNKFNKLCSAASQNTVKYNTADLLEQIQQLRNESRKLREMNHTLDEENHQLKEILWDLKQQNKWLPKEQFKGKMLSSEITIKGNRTISGTERQMCAKESETMLQKMSSVPSRLHCISSPSQISFEYFNIEDKIGPIKSNEKKMISDQRLKSCDDGFTERSTSSRSLTSIDSDNTEALLASCNDVTSGQLIHSNIHQNSGSMLDLDGLSEDDTSLPNQNNPHQQFQIAHGSSSNLCKPVTSPPDFHSSCLNRNTTSRSLVDKAALPRRPFAPRSIADLKIGHLVKFSRPAGKIGKGVIKYLGHLPGRQEAYMGVELEGTEVGQHNGTFEGVRYFMCKKNKGVFVNFSKVIMAWD